MILAKTMEKDNFLSQDQDYDNRLSEPIYFLRAGALMSVSALIAAPFVFILLFLSKVFRKYLAYIL